MRPLVTVVMPVYNAAPYVRDAAGSILSGSYREVELLALDDGSTDESAQILRDMRDSRIRLVANPANMGVIATLNRGLELASGEYFARMDADDLSLPARLERQVSLMQANPALGLCGTWVRNFGHGPETIERVPVGHNEIFTRLFAFNALAHSTVMMRASAMRKHSLRYAADAKHAEDLDLWMRAAEVFEVGNIPEVLLRYRIHANQVTQVHSAGQNDTLNALRRRQLLRLMPDASEQELALHLSIMQLHKPTRRADLPAMQAWLLKLQEANDASARYDRASFQRFLEARWLNVVHRCEDGGVAAWSIWRGSRLARPVSAASARLLLKKLMRS